MAGKIMNTVLIVIVVWLVLLILTVCIRQKPTKSIVERYGQPIHHFSSQKCWKTLRIRGSRIDMDFYSDFIVISDEKNEWIIDKDFEDYEFYGSHLINSVFEIKVDDETVQMTLTQKQKKLLYDFFDTY